MQSLSPTVAYWDPGQQLRLHNQSSRDPELILLLSWMAARDEHIAKYVAQHRTLFPSSRILLIRCPMLRIWLPWMARRDLNPALPLLLALAKGGNGRADDALRPRVLVHLFSSGGISTAVHLEAVMLAARLDDGGRSVAALPCYVLLLDSCPGYFRWRNTHRALVQTLPWWASPLMHVAIAVACVYHGLRRLSSAQNQNARALRDARLLSHECRRTYLYGTADDKVDYTDVENNARKAEEAEFAVRRERLEGAEHVANARAEPARYWRAVRESWERERSERQAKIRVLLARKIQYRAGSQAKVRPGRLARQPEARTETARPSKSDETAYVLADAPCGSGDMNDLGPE